ncbi:hypothetical protein BC830DRAFT_1049170, partial [Chytriomyces sp. MP71]
ETFDFPGTTVNTKRRLRILIASDLVARGLDFAAVRKVFLFDFPTSMQHYLHRTGRTAR